MSYATTISIYAGKGIRKYLNEVERKRFYNSCDILDEEKALFALMIFWTGARPSEVLSLLIEQIDFADSIVVITSLKKRRNNVHRPIPLPKSYIRRLQKFLVSRMHLKEELIWQFSYRSASRYIKNVMIEADIKGIHACARGLRHSFAVKAVMESIPLTTIKKWMGHTSIKTTSIYLNVVGPEERKFAKRMWKNY